MQVLAGLGAACGSGADPGALRTSVQRQVVIGLFRDLRGITMATNSRRNYGVHPPSSPAPTPRMSNEAWSHVLLAFTEYTASPPCAKVCACVSVQLDLAEHLSVLLRPLLELQHLCYC